LHRSQDIADYRSIITDDDDDDDDDDDVDRRDRLSLAHWLEVKRTPKLVVANLASRNSLRFLELFRRYSRA